jgi:hypothetical protein
MILLPTECMILNMRLSKHLIRPKLLRPPQVQTLLHNTINLEVQAQSIKVQSTRRCSTGQEKLIKTSQPQQTERENKVQDGASLARWAIDGSPIERTTGNRGDLQS